MKKYFLNLYFNRQQIAAANDWLKNNSQYRVITCETISTTKLNNKFVNPCFTSYRIHQKKGIEHELFFDLVKNLRYSTTFQFEL